MALDHLQNSGLTRAVTDLLADLAELLQKELRLAKTEITEKITFRAARWWRAFRRLCGMRFPTAMTAIPFFSLRRQLPSRPRWGSPISDGTTEVDEPLCTLEWWYRRRLPHTALKV